MGRRFKADGRWMALGRGRVGTVGSLVIAGALTGICPSLAFANAPAHPSKMAEAEKECPVKTNTARSGVALKPPVMLQPTAQSNQKLVNFGTSREPKIVRHLTVSSDKPLPPSLTSAQINYDAVLSRTGDTLQTAEFPEPTFSPAYISHDRRSISFAMCLNPKDIEPGKYVGSIGVGGPEGLGGAAITLTANAKDGELFTIAWIVALFAAFGLLVLKDTVAAKTGDSVTWGSAFVKGVWNPFWVVATIIALFVTFGALYKVYSDDPSWGATGFAGLIALVGTATAAVGGHAIVTTLGSKHS
jgi:hypothetical protein